MRIFLDSSILFSAAKSNGAVRLLIDRLHADGHVLCADTYVLGEASRNLEAKGREGLPWLEALAQRLDIAAFQRSALPAEAASLLPEKDQPVLVAAIRLRCDALVTGDRTHFGRLYGVAFESVTVYSPRSLAEALLV